MSRTGGRVEVLVRKRPPLHHRPRDGPKHLLHSAQRVVGVRAREEEATCGELEQAASQAPDINRRAVLRAEDELRRAVQPATQLSPSDPAVLLFSGPKLAHNKRATMSANVCQCGWRVRTGP